MKWGLTAVYSALLYAHSLSVRSPFLFPLIGSPGAAYTNECHTIFQYIRFVYANGVYTLDRHLPSSSPSPMFAWDYAICTQKQKSLKHGIKGEYYEQLMAMMMTMMVDDCDVDDDGSRQRVDTHIKHRIIQPTDNIGCDVTLSVRLQRRQIKMYSIRERSYKNPTGTNQNEHRTATVGSYISAAKYKCIQ